jgi:hypothetical protein
MTGHWPWITLAALGAYHGLNPAMGWLFAVSRGMQERSQAAVLRSLGPIAAGHELSLALVAGVVLLADSAVSPAALRAGAAAVLAAFALWRFLKPRWHPRWTAMRVNGAELAWWSFLMASAHGAGLMIAPVIIGLDVQQSGAHLHAEDLDGVGAPVAPVLFGLAVHVAAMLAVMAVVAVVVYSRLGVEVLRRAWLNTDRIWAAAFVMAAAITLVS